MAQKRNVWQGGLVGLMLIALLLPLLALSTNVRPTLVNAADDTARLRAIHAVPDIAGSPVDVYVGTAPFTIGQAAVPNFDFFTVTPYLTVPAGATDIRIVAAGGDPNDAEQTLISASVTLEAGQDYSAVAHGTAADDGVALGATLLTDDNARPDANQAHVRVAHFAPNAPAVDIFVNGERSAITNLVYLNASTYVPLPAGSYTFGVAPAGGDPIYTVEVTLAAGQVVTAWANGLLAGENGEVPEAQAFKVTPSIDQTYMPDPESETARLRAVHAVPDIGSPVDVYVGTAPFTMGEATVPNFDFFTVTPYLTVPAGATDIRIVAAGGDPNDAAQAVISTTVTLEAGQDYSAVAHGTAAEDEAALGAILLTDDNMAPSPGQARIRVAHFAPNAPAVDIFVNGERSAITNLAYLNASTYVPLPAGSYTFGVAPTGGDPIYTVEVTLEAGQVVTAWANGLLGAEAENDAALATQAFKVTPSVDVSYFYLRGVHALPDVAGTPVDVYVDDTRVATFDFFGTTDYLPLVAGRAYNVRIVAAGGDPDDALITGSLPDTLEAGAEYSLVAHRPVAPGEPSVTLLTDDNTRPDANQARVRVAHFSPNAPAVDIFVNGERSAITNLAYLNTSPYVPLPAGTYTFGVAPTGGEPIYTVDVTLEAGQVVTAWANGLLAGENDEVPEAQAFKVTPTIDRAYAVEAPSQIRVYLPIIVR